MRSSGLSDKNLDDFLTKVSNIFSMNRLKVKVQNISKGSLDSITSPSVKIQKFTWDNKAKNC